MKYFFLSEGWTYERVWEFGGLWNYSRWRRNPEIRRLDIGIKQQGETLWLYQVEDAIIMLEVKSIAIHQNSAIGQVVLKRLIAAEQVIKVISKAEGLTNNRIT